MKCVYVNTTDPPIESYAPPTLLLTTLFLPPPMSSSTPTQASSSRPRTGSETGTGTSKALVPTNNVTTLDGTIVRARIDPALTVDDVVKQLCVNLKIKGHSTDYALRDESDELVTSENLRKKIKGKVNLRYVFCSSRVESVLMATRLVNSPLFEAISVIEKLNKGDAKPSRMTLFSLQKMVKVCRKLPHIFHAFTYLIGARIRAPVLEI